MQQQQLMSLFRRGGRRPCQVSGRPGARRVYISDRKLQQLVKLLQTSTGDSQVYPILSRPIARLSVAERPQERQKISQILNSCIPDVNQQAVVWYDAAKKKWRR